MAARSCLWTAEDLWHLPGHEKQDIHGGRPTGPKALERRLGPFRRAMVEFRVIQHLGEHVLSRNLGFVGPGVGFVGADGRALHPPDLAFLRKEPLPPADEWDGLSLAPPDLAAEVVSPIDDDERVAEEIVTYLAGGIPLLELVTPERHTIAVHRPSQPATTLTEGDELDGGDVFRDFRVPVAELFG